jgi:glutaconate CoA-transferase subunit A
VLVLDRKDKLSSLKDALKLVPDGAVLGIGGFINSHQPMAFIRGLIKKGVKDLTVVGPASAGVGTDLLIGASCVKKVVAPYVGAEETFPIAPNFRRAVEKGEIEVWECGEGIFYASLYAGIWNIPAMLWKGGVGTSIPKLNPDIKEIEFEGEKVLAIKPTKIDVFVTHVPECDEYGNGCHLGTSWGDDVMAKAADKVIVTTEKLIQNSSLDPFKTTISADMVVELEYGAHPTACNACYMEDERALKEYSSEASKIKEDPNAFKRYLEKYLTSHEDYVKKIGEDRFKELRFEREDK